jgi:mRNA interferase MazF
MKRGEIWTVSGGGDYAGKPRPAVIVQDDAFDATGSVTICAFTTDPTEAPLFRVAVEPDTRNGLQARSRLMVDKITTVARSRLGSRVGQLAQGDMARLNRAALGFLGLTSPRQRA